LVPPRKNNPSNLKTSALASDSQTQEGSSTLAPKELPQAWVEPDTHVSEKVFGNYL
jgi:hypothetical protein